MAIDLSRLTSGLVLPPSVSNEIWTNATEGSVIMQVSRKMDLPGPGITVPVIQGDAQAAWVNETDEKPVSRPTLSNKSMTPYTVAVIVPFSNQLKRDANALYNTIVRALPNALAKTFDETVFGYRSVPGSNFGSLASATAVSINGANGTKYASLISAVAASYNANQDVSAFLMAPAATLLLLGELDGDGRPLFTLSPNAGGPNSIGALLGAPVYKSRHVYYNPASGADVIGWAGPFADRTVWGQTGNIEISISDQATINDGGTQLNLWQRNMSAARCEVELGFQLVGPASEFAKLTGATTA